MTHAAVSKSVWFLKASADEKQDGLVCVRPEQPLDALQYSRVVVDD